MPPFARYINSFTWSLNEFIAFFDFACGKDPWIDIFEIMYGFVIFLFLFVLLTLYKLFTVLRWEEDPFICVLEYLNSKQTYLKGLCGL